MIVVAKDPLTDIENLKTLQMTVKRGAEYRRRTVSPGLVWPNVSRITVGSATEMDAFSAAVVKLNL
jgi:hypothetical protein